MNSSVKILVGCLASGLIACAGDGTSHQLANEKPVENNAALSNKDLPPPAKQEPPMTMSKNGTTLALVRMMDGAVCKNDQEGVMGTFMVYANPDDIARIKRDKGNKVFSEFETKIEAFSERVLQLAVDKTNLAADPFALGEDVAQQKLAQQLDTNFRLSVSEAIAGFEKETTLTIDVSPFPASFIFYQNGCNAHLPELTDNDNAKSN
ncbi:MAG: hypothetical protein K9L60_08330 [Methylovulum sp.]|nr:hypothetical protein [Methylovulum sp.]MCF7999189.1 hypothetical protein [Methylovulum sp.]